MQNLGILKDRKLDMEKFDEAIENMLPVNSEEEQQDYDRELLKWGILKIK